MRNSNDYHATGNRKTRWEVENTAPARPPYSYGSKPGESPLRLSQEREYIRERREAYHKSSLETEVALLKYSSVEKLQHSPQNLQST